MVHSMAAPPSGPRRGEPDTECHKDDADRSLDPRPSTNIHGSRRGARQQHEDETVPGDFDHEGRREDRGFRQDGCVRGNGDGIETDEEDDPLGVREIDQAAETEAAKEARGPVSLHADAFRSIVRTSCPGMTPRLNPKPNQIEAAGNLDRARQPADAFEEDR